MGLPLKDMALCSVFAVALPIGQVLFKFAANHDATLKGPFVLRLVHNLPLMAAFAWYGVTAIFWFYVLTRVPLARAYAFSMVGSGLVPILAWVFFRETITWQMVAGFLVILAGLFLVSQARA